MYALFWTVIAIVLLVNPVAGLSILLILSLMHIAILQPKEPELHYPEEPDIDDDLVHFMYTKSQYLRSVEWKTKRKASLLRYEYRCGRCKSDGEALDIHHLFGYDLLPHEPQEALIPLCRKCHQIQHEKHGYPSTFEEYMSWNKPLV